WDADGVRLWLTHEPENERLQFSSPDVHPAGAHRDSGRLAHALRDGGDRADLSYSGRRRAATVWPPDAVMAAGACDSRRAGVEPGDQLVALRSRLAQG